MGLKNLMEDEVMYTVNKLLSDRKDMCTCDKCKLDIAAIVLNVLPPRYVVTEKGKLYGKVENMSYQFDVDVITEVTKAINIVKNSPHHNKQE
ncbi:late competence development ComFB family protein [Anaerosalibacter sp. Marseille-P3206]|uniref:late competence development ComFB family protein n=1 Tax=Anaerosalibacter sp. Marseille-P3206 TaxID=1871005 RepID=UPI00190E9656|nr:late competence development ComFB family protein [Anaerosalibacter sp. Marseille-P3206]